LAFLVALLLGRWGVVTLLQGSTSSTRLLGVINLADPFGALEIMLASRAVYLPLLLAAGIILVVYALVGRAYCAWICPLGLLLDLADELRERLGKRRRLKFSRRIKYGLLALFLFLSLAVGIPAFTLVSPINILARNLLFGFGPEILLVVAIVGFEVAFSQRAWCRYFCPLGAFYSLLGRWGLVRVRVADRGAKCTRCGHCTLHCPMGINVLRDYVRAGRLTVGDPECIRCGVCVEGCEGGGLRLGLALPLSR